MTQIGTRLEKLRARVLPPTIDEQGWAPLWNLFYLGFLFMNWGGDRPSGWLPATLLSIAIFSCRCISTLMGSPRAGCSSMPR